MASFTNDTTKAFANLANVTAANRQMMSDLMATNKALLLDQNQLLLEQLALSRTTRKSQPPQAPAGAGAAKKCSKNPNYC
jgi:hypothetical protein